MVSFTIHIVFIYEDIIYKTVNDLHKPNKI